MILVRDLRRILDVLPANQEVFVDIPNVKTLKRFTGVTYESEDDKKDPIVVFAIDR